MRIATWNVNSIRARLEHLSAWLTRRNPDVVCLQETKVEDERFPFEALRECGYEPVVFGQRTYNGVALLSRFGLRAEDVRKNLSSDPPDAQRRALSASFDGVRVVCLYAPNGQEVGSPAFAQKLDWFDRLRDELERHHDASEELVLLGDFNVAPAELDVHDPAKWRGSVLFHPDERARLRRLLDWGLLDAFREKHPTERAFTWWDYRLGGFKKDWGLRIDHALATRPLLERVRSVEIDRSPRALERPSDHAPLVLELD